MSASSGGCVEVPDIRVAPTEPPLLKSLGHVSSIPERYGVDFLFACHGQLIGAQRKTIDDFLASLRDGRLNKEIQLMTDLHHRILILEGRLAWATDGTLLRSHTTFHRSQLASIITSMQFEHGIRWWHTADLQDTRDYLLELHAWFQKPKHMALLSRPGPARNPWGKVSNHERKRWFLQGIDRIGADRADAMLEKFGGVPMKWTCSEKEMAEVRGIGKKTAKELMEFLK